MDTGAYYQLPVYSKGNCPDTLAWDDKTMGCFLIECFYPVYTFDQQQAILISTQVFGCISFILCYFYCITSLFRPAMMKFPNSNLFFFHFSMMIASLAFIFVLLLGPRYVGCDSNTEIGENNWACYVTG